MRETTIARNYAEALLELARKGNDLRGWGELIEGVANGIESDRRLRVFLESPRVSVKQKSDIFQKAQLKGAVQMTTMPHKKGDAFELRFHLVSQDETRHYDGKVTGTASDSQKCCLPTPAQAGSPQSHRALCRLSRGSRSTR